jgi:haloacetate dehalogenase
MALDHPDAVERLAVLNMLNSILDSWPASPKAISSEARQEYLRAFNEETIRGICADYRASFHVDRHLDAEDRDTGRRIQCPVLVHWGSEEKSLSDSLEVWKRWAGQVQGSPLPAGHFIPEEAPEKLAASLEQFLRS